MRIVRLFAVFGIAYYGRIECAKQTKTFPGAETVIPAFIGQVLPGIIGVITGGGGGSIIPPVSISHSTSVATSVANKPIAVSGSISTSANTSAGSHASVGHGSTVSVSSSTGTSAFRSLSSRWRKFFKNIT
ncbi:uncharacterized protein LOC129782200 isoform X2 [Toxorhynchites rutilus septentrionalis]|uniref:uncharacterized protein LOC129781917 isoform X2 n=1 Tax=Toxorhynchites rutilus septentrionalis TaxID=329112 RepID=UPI00247A01E7|nr:uncharacterized protein LOC129781917 isoform X2 [Toxorhynchites rutilus septentrionalis]XP_055645544.1 uncharacterized protein LOC129782200 isoform X2 [Toxorhynchites rutilus septentrionalis]